MSHGGSPLRRRQLDGEEEDDAGRGSMAGAGSGLTAPAGDDNFILRGRPLPSATDSNTHRSYVQTVDVWQPSKEARERDQKTNSKKKKGMPHVAFHSHSRVFFYLSFSGWPRRTNYTCPYRMMKRASYMICTQKRTDRNTGPWRVPTHISVPLRSQSSSLFLAVFSFIAFFFFFFLLLVLLL